MVVLLMVVLLMVVLCEEQLPCAPSRAHGVCCFRLSAAHYFPPACLIRSIALVIVTLAAS
jgi:hypothetical protein